MSKVKSNILIFCLDMFFAMLITVVISLVYAWDIEVVPACLFFSTVFILPLAFYSIFEKSGAKLYWAITMFEIAIILFAFVAGRIYHTQDGSDDMTKFVLVITAVGSVFIFGWLIYSRKTKNWQILQPN